MQSFEKKRKFSNYNILLQTTLPTHPYKKTIELFTSVNSPARFPLKGLSQEIFGPVCWPVWMHLGLNKNRFWFLNFKEAPSI